MNQELTNVLPDVLLECPGSHISDLRHRALRRFRNRRDAFRPRRETRAGQDRVYFSTGKPRTSGMTLGARKHLSSTHAGS